MGKKVVIAKKALKPTTGDTAHMIVKGALGTVPYVGGFAAELFNAVVTPPLEKRKAEWMLGIEERLRKLEADGLNVRGLQDNPEFIDVVLQASQAVLRTSVDEKKQALANAVINAAKGQGITGTKQQMFVALIDQFNEWHIRLLKFAVAPELYHLVHRIQWPNISMGAFSNIIESAFPDLRGQREFYDIVWKDLSDRGLVTTPGIHGTGTGEGLKQGRVSATGNEFLAFIAD